MNYLSINAFLFFRITRVSRTAFFNGLTFRVVLHDLHHVTQAEAFPAGVPGQCLYVKTAFQCVC